MKRLFSLGLAVALLLGLALTVGASEEPVRPKTEPARILLLSEENIPEAAKLLGTLRGVSLLEFEDREHAEAALKAFLDQGLVAAMDAPAAEKPAEEPEQATEAKAPEAEETDLFLLLAERAETEEEIDLSAALAKMPENLSETFAWCVYALEQGAETLEPPAGPFRGENGEDLLAALLEAEPEQIVYPAPEQTAESAEAPAEDVPEETPPEPSQEAPAEPETPASEEAAAEGEVTASLKGDTDLPTIDLQEDDIQIDDSPSGGLADPTTIAGGSTSSPNSTGTPTSTPTPSPTATAKPASGTPNTGDDSNTGVFVLIGIASLLGIVVLTVYDRRRTMRM